MPIPNVKSELSQLCYKLTDSAKFCFWENRLHLCLDSNVILGSTVPIQPPAVVLLANSLIVQQQMLGTLLEQFPEELSTHHPAPV